VATQEKAKKFIILHFPGPRSSARREKMHAQHPIFNSFFIDSYFIYDLLTSIKYDLFNNIFYYLREL